MNFLTTFADLQTELQSRLNASSTSPLFTTTLIQQQINNAYAWAGRQFKWPALRTARITDTNGQANYDYPTDFQPNSIVRLEVAGLDDPEFDREDFDAFLSYTETYPTYTEKQIFANYWTQFFIFPIQAANPGSGNLSIWGYKQVSPLVNTNDITIFSSVDPLGNEAIVKQALAVCEAIAQGKGLSQVESQEAKDTLAMIFGKIKEDDQNDQQIGKAMFNIPDFFRGTTQASPIGGFSITVKQ